MVTTPLQVAVIGWGNFFGHIHARTLADAIAEGACVLRAVCERDAGRRAAIARCHPEAAIDDSLAAVLGDESVDAVIIGAPQQVQAELSVAALQAGKYVYCEKPFFATAAETGAEPAAHVARLAGLGALGEDRLAIGFNKRFAPAYQELRELGRSWGGIRHLQLNVVDDAWRWNAGRYGDGFLLWLDLCHWVDLARWFTGAEVVRISCLEPQANDAQVTMQMSDRAVVSLLLSGNGSMDMLKEETRITCSGRRSAVVSDYIELEAFGGDRTDRRRYPGNLQEGGDPAYLERIAAEGLAGFRTIRRELFDRFMATSASAPGGDEHVRRNVPNFMRAQGWRASLRAFLAACAAGAPLRAHAGWRDAWTAYRLLDAVRASLASDGDFVAVADPPVVEVPSPTLGGTRRD